MLNADSLSESVFFSPPRLYFSSVRFVSAPEIVFCRVRFSGRNVSNSEYVRAPNGSAR
jgi:hypothetical protein